jgi:hypothetical protein
MRHFCKGIYSFVFHLYHSDIGVYGTEGEIFCWCGVGFGECVEERRFSDIRKSDDSDFHAIGINN